MNTNDFREIVKPFFENARELVKDHAKKHCPNVPSKLVNNVAEAIGEISIDEAIMTLNQQEMIAKSEKEQNHV